MTWPAVNSSPSPTVSAGMKFPAAAETTTRNWGVGSKLGAAPWRAIRSRAFARSSGVLTVTISIPLRARFARPARVPAGGSSITAVTPISARVRIHRSHRTGAVTCRTNRWSMVGPWSTALPSRLDSRILVGAPGVIPPATVARACSAGAMNGVWNAPATASLMTLTLAGGSAANFSRFASAPAATIWPAPLRLAGYSPTASIAAITSSGSPPRTALMPVASSAQAAAISRPRTPASVTAASGLSTPAMAAAPSSPTLCPATTATSYIGSCSAASNAAATSNGWVRAVSLISSASAVVPSWTRSSPASADHQRRRASTPVMSSHGVRKPGFWEPCPGASTASTSMTVPESCASRRIATHETQRFLLEGSSKSLPGVIPTTADVTLRSRPLTDCRDRCGHAGRIESPDRERDPQGEGVPGGQWREAAPLADAAQPVPDGVRVNEQGPGRTLQYPAGGEERVQRLQQFAAGPHHGAVDVLAEDPAGLGVAGQRPLGQQVGGGHRPGGRRPGR